MLYWCCVKFHALLVLLVSCSTGAVLVARSTGAVLVARSTGAVLVSSSTDAVSSMLYWCC